MLWIIIKKYNVVKLECKWWKLDIIYSEIGLLDCTLYANWANLYDISGMYSNEE